MSEPTYRIDSEYKPGHDDDTVPYRAEAIRLSDGYGAFVAWGATRTDAIARVQSMIRAHSTHGQLESLEVDENGDPVSAPVPQSLRA